jgi:hypothetical protein
MRVSFVLRSAEESSETLMHCGQVKNRNVIIPYPEYNILLRAIGFIGGRLRQTLVIAVVSAVFQAEMYNNNTPEKMCEFWVHASSKSSKIGMSLKGSKIGMSVK